MSKHVHETYIIIWGGRSMTFDDLKVSKNCEISHSCPGECSHKFYFNAFSMGVLCDKGIDGQDLYRIVIVIY